VTLLDENSFLKMSRTSYAGARSSVVGRGTVLQAGRSWVRFRMRSLDFSVDVILTALSALRAGRHLPPREIPGTHFC
jgi:hypothetical protein